MHQSADPGNTMRAALQSCIGAANATIRETQSDCQQRAEICDCASACNVDKHSCAPTNCCAINLQAWDEWAHIIACGQQHWRAWLACLQSLHLISTDIFFEPRKLAVPLAPNRELNHPLVGGGTDLQPVNRGTVPRVTASLRLLTAVLTVL
jgi:hypothetical protein